MTNELEKQFFQCFGIEPKWKSEQCDGWLRTTAVAYFTNLEEAKKFGIVFQEEPEYPQISDRILLELMALLMKQEYTEFYYQDDVYLFSSKSLGSNRPTCNRVNNLRELILKTATCLGGFTPLKDEMLPQVQALFKEVE